MDWLFLMIRLLIDFAVGGIFKNCARSLTLYKLPRTLVVPRNQDLVNGTDRIGGTGNTSFTSFRLIKNLFVPTTTPKRDEDSTPTWFAASLSFARIAS